MSRAELEGAAEEKYPAMQPDEEYLIYPRSALREFRRAAYIRGRLDQAEADKRMILSTPGGSWEGNRFAAAIRKGVE